LTIPTPTLATGDATAKVQAMVNMANSLVGKPYVWGGGHGGWGPQSGYDCSGFVSAVLHAGGYLSSPADTTSMPNQPGIEAGPGQYVTIYDRAQPGENGHVIIKINGQFYESGGSAGAWGGGGGVEKIGTPSASYLASFPNVLHPAGL
jgi:cell wall-associated NlpC family hydrolase